MKKVFVLLLTMLLLVPTAYAQAADVEEICAYSLEEESVLTVELAANPTTGYEWSYAISEEGFVDPMSDTFIADENDEDLTGVGGTYVAKFETSMDQAGSVLVTFTYNRPWDQESEPAETVVFDLFVNEAGLISVENVTRTTVPFAE